MPAMVRVRGPQLTVRDGLALRWVGEQFGTRLDVLGVVLARLNPTVEGPVVSDRVARHVSDRWRQVGLAERASLLGAQWVVPTSKGLAAGELTAEPANGGDPTPWPGWRPALHMLQHTHAVAMVRLAVEAAGGGGAWVAERHLRREVGAKAFHLPDAELRAGNRRVLVEVELTPKDDVRVLEALRTVRPEATEMLWLTWPEQVQRMRTQLNRVITRLVEMRWQPPPERPEPAGKGRVVFCRVETLPEVPGATYAGRW